jgi:hypothetical protein
MDGLSLSSFTAGLEKAHLSKRADSHQVQFRKRRGISLARQGWLVGATHACWRFPSSEPWVNGQWRTREEVGRSWLHACSENVQERYLHAAALPVDGSGVVLRLVSVASDDSPKARKGSQGEGSLAGCMQIKQVSGWVGVDVVQASTGGRSYMRSKDGVFFFCFSHAGHRRSMTGGGGNAISTRGPRLADACQDRV